MASDESAAGQECHAIRPLPCGFGTGKLGSSSIWHRSDRKASFGLSVDDPASAARQCESVRGLEPRPVAASRCWSTTPAELNALRARCGRPISRVIPVSSRQKPGCRPQAQCFRLRSRRLRRGRRLLELCHQPRRGRRSAGASAYAVNLVWKACSADIPVYFGHCKGSQIFEMSPDAVEAEKKNSMPAHDSLTGNDCTSPE